VPSEKVVELVKGKKKTSSRKFFPGYILVNMELNDETWHIVKSTPKVTGFVGGALDPSSVPPISEEEVRASRTRWKRARSSRSRRCSSKKAST
jgi:transcription termination/antitermination protein NusG